MLIGQRHNLTVVFRGEILGGKIRIRKVFRKRKKRTVFRAKALRLNLGGFISRKNRQTHTHNGP